MRRFRPVPVGLVLPEPKPPVEPINNNELVLGFRAEGGGVFHIRPRKNFDGKWSRGMTVAFKLKGGRAEVATAVTHRVDCFTKKIGTKTAIDHFRAGKTVFLPVGGDRPAQSLQYFFSDLV